MSVGVPLYLGEGRESRFVFFHPSEPEEESRSGVVVCAPWGWDEVASHRSRMRWAERLSAAGHPALRFDLPAVGDSAATPTDPGLLDSWLDAIAGAAAWLRDRAGPGSVALLGLGLGGLLAREAIARGAPVDQLVSWAAPVSGRAFGRETRAFSRLQGWPDEGEAEAAGGPGAIEAGGFLLAGEVRDALGKLDPAPGGTGALRRALLLDRDGIATDPSWVEGLEAGGVDVECAGGEGWGLMTSHPDASRLPDAAAETVERWLAADPAPAPRVGQRPTVESESLTLAEPRAEETPWKIDESFGRVFGVLTEPLERDPGGDLWAVFLNAGAVSHAGPDRLWTEAARRAAGHGVSCLRVDLKAIGESAGDETQFSDVAEFYTPEYVAQVRAVLDDLGRRGARRFVLIGLCSGGYWSFQAALDDPRVKSVILLNAGAIVWHRDLLTDHAIRDLSRFRSLDWWRRLLRGELNPRSVLRLARVLGAKSAQLIRRLGGALRRTPPGGPTVDSLLDRLAELDTSVTVAFSGGEGLHARLESEGVVDRLARWPNVRLDSLPGSDHSLRPLAAQRAAAALIDRQIAAAGETLAPPETVPATSDP